MFRFRLLPWEYGVRNLLRRPGRSALTLAGLALVALLIFVVVGFIRGLEENLAVSGDPEVVVVHSLGTEGHVEISSVPTRASAPLTASLEGIRRRPGPGGTPAVYASGALYLRPHVGAEGE